MKNNKTSNTKTNNAVLIIAHFNLQPVLPPLCLSRGLLFVRCCCCCCCCCCCYWCWKSQYDQRLPSQKILYNTHLFIALVHNSSFPSSHLEDNNHHYSSSSTRQSSFYQYDEFVSFFEQSEHEKWKFGTRNGAAYHVPSAQEAKRKYAIPNHCGRTVREFGEKDWRRKLQYILCCLLLQRSIHTKDQRKITIIWERTYNYLLQHSFIIYGIFY